MNVVKHTLVDYCWFYTSSSVDIHDCPDVYLEMMGAKNGLIYSLRIILYTLFNTCANNIAYSKLLCDWQAFNITPLKEGRNLDLPLSICPYEKF